MAPPVTKNIVAHDCEKGGRVRPVQGLKLDPGPVIMDIKYLFECFSGKENIWFEYSPGLWVTGGHSKVVEHKVQELSRSIHF